MKRIKITGCSDHLMWYTHDVGTLHDIKYEDEECFWIYDHEGRLSPVLKRDVETVVKQPTIADKSRSPGPGTMHRMHL